MLLRNYEAIVIGISAGGISALKHILPQFPNDFPLPIVIVQHVGNSDSSFMAKYFGSMSKMNVKEAEIGEKLVGGTIYIAPAGYHLLIENDKTFGLSADPKVNFCCPSIDVLFDSAANAYGSKVIGIVMTGANSDGSNGLGKIKGVGGLAIVQNPSTAEFPAMPQAAINTTKVDHICNLEEIVSLLSNIVGIDNGDMHDKHSTSA